MLGILSIFCESIFEKINEKEKYETKFDSQQILHVLSKNFSIANIKFSFAGHKPIVMPLNDLNYPIFSIHDLDNFSSIYLREEQYSALLKYAYDQTKALQEIKNETNELNHSEKGMFGYIYQHSKQIIKDLIQLLKDQNYDLSPFNSIEIQMYTFRDSCVYCESFLSSSSWLLFSCLLKEFLQLRNNNNDNFLYAYKKENIFINKVLSFSMYLNNSSHLQEEQHIPKHLKSKYLKKIMLQKIFSHLNF